MIWLLVSVQLVEVLWVIFSYIGIEHIKIESGKLHLDYLPFSHSVFTALVLAILAWLIISKIFKNNKAGIAIAIGIISHVIIDIIFHEPDIQLAPFINKPEPGLGIVTIPLLNFTLEMAY